MTRAGFTRLFQPSFQLYHIVVGIAIALRFTQTHAVNDRRVVQRVGNNSVFRAQQRLKQAAVSVETGGIQNRIFHAEEACQLLLQRFVAVLGAADKTHGRHTETVAVHARFCGINQLRVIRQPEIVIGAKVNNVASIRHGDIRLLRRRNNALFFKQSFRPGGFQIVG
ncbi:Uncharacterised protein [Salmonella enterica subsp. enterica serovar Typhi]|nr:Uncharacterised protein [Salmonella enterica subsp. enterica serovar Typhi]